MFFVRFFLSCFFSLDTEVVDVEILAEQCPLASSISFRFLVELDGCSVGSV